MQAIGQHNVAWEEWFTSHGIDPLRVRHEELDTDMQGVAEGILTFPGLKARDRRAIAPRHECQADELNNQWIDRYRRSRATTLVSLKLVLV